MKSKEEQKAGEDQQDLYQNAQQRVKKKKNLATHLVIFLAGAVVLIVLNMVLGFGEKFTPFNMPWFVWAILLWFFFLLVHAINVFMIHRLMGKEWEKRQMEKLVNKQLRRIEKLQKKVDKQHPLPNKKDGPSPTKSTATKSTAAKSSSTKSNNT